jgi:DNA primase
MPLSWDELTARVKPDRWNVRNVGRRLESMPRDPWDEPRLAKSA